MKENIEIVSMKKSRWGIRIGLLFLFLLFVLGYCLYQRRFQVQRPSLKKYPIRGVDVSYYQGNIDWTLLSAQNIVFAFIKATEGSSHVDPKFAENWEEAAKTDLMIGAYHFFSFESDGKTQAEHFIDTVDKKENMLPPAIDIEFYGKYKQNQVDAHLIRENLKACLDELEAYYGIKPIIYATDSSYSHLIRGYFDEYPLWIRNVYFSPNIGMPGKWTFWQYTSMAQWKGYEGEEKNIDLDIFYGSEEEWEDCYGKR